MLHKLQWDSIPLRRTLIWAYRTVLDHRDTDLALRQQGLSGEVTDCWRVAAHQP